MRRLSEDGEERHVQAQQGAQRSQGRHSGQTQARVGVAHVAKDGKAMQLKGERRKESRGLSAQEGGQGEQQLLQGLERERRLNEQTRRPGEEGGVGRLGSEKAEGSDEEDLVGDEGRREGRGGERDDMRR